jgi:hypothetical protein
MNSRYEISEEDIPSMFAEGTGRRIEGAEPVVRFADLPFANEVGDWRLPDGSFMWVRFDDGAYWLIVTSAAVPGQLMPNPLARKYYALLPLQPLDDTDLSSEEYELIGRDILAAYDAGKDAPSEPLYTGHIRSFERIAIYRRGYDDGFGLLRMVSDVSSTGQAHWSECSFPWSTFREHPGPMLEVSVTNF